MGHFRVELNPHQFPVAVCRRDTHPGDPRNVGIGLQVAVTDQAAVELSKYIKQHASLAFLVTRQDASHIEALLKKTELLYGSRLPVPLVFINPDKNVAEDVEAAVIPAFL